MVKIDPHNHAQQWERIRRSANKKDFQQSLILQFLTDLKEGVNVKRGQGTERSPARLCSIHGKLMTVNDLLRSHYQTDVLKCSEKQLQELFQKMRDGSITKANGSAYRSYGYYSKAIKQFWAWYMRREKRKGNKIEDKTEYLNVSTKKGKWTYLSFDQVKQMAEKAKYDYRVLMWFLFDTGIRAPTELANFRARDFYEKDGYYWVHIREETSKTKGRKFKVPLCGEIVARYIKQEHRKPDEPLFPMSYSVMLKYIQTIGYKVHKIGKLVTREESKGAGLRRVKSHVVEGLKPYDFRHNSACYWVEKHQDKPAFLQYRFGWSSPDLIRYYTEFLGLSDPTSHEDVIDAEEKGVLRMNGERQKQRIEELESQLQELRHDMDSLVSERVAHHLQAMAPLLESKGIRIKKKDAK